MIMSDHSFVLYAAFSIPISSSVVVDFFAERFLLQHTSNADSPLPNASPAKSILKNENTSRYGRLGVLLTFFDCVRQLFAIGFGQKQSQSA